MGAQEIRDDSFTSSCPAFHLLGMEALGWAQCEFSELEKLFGEVDLIGYTARTTKTRPSVEKLLNSLSNLEGHSRINTEYCLNAFQFFGGDYLGVCHEVSKLQDFYK
jgi:hypothetical protein